MAFAKENTEVQISLMPEETIYYHCPSYNALSSDSRTSIKQAWKKKKKSRDSPLSPELFISVTFKPSPKELAEMDLLWGPTMQAVGFTNGTGNSFLTRT